ncbi:MAG TPA: sulfurtransferase TusA family protein [Nitrospiria bacterium]|nr:sulfurtransferase TusA family protein [Nitrospiria bacterium]
MGTTISPQKLTVDLSKIPAEVLKEIEIFEGEVARLKRGEITADQFKPFRLQHGVYGQRQPGVQMFRVKIPLGRLNPAQLRRLADVAETYASGVCHLSTRQNIQMHFAMIESVSTMMRLIAEVGLTTREACADTVRNVTACPMAGISPTEVVDVTPYGLAITQHFLRNPICQKLPRKFKIALEGCTDQDHAATAVHDIGVTARKRDGQLRFRIVVGGGLGSTPRTANVLDEFAPPEDLVAICEAIIRVFDRHGQRQNRYKARMKFLVEKLGFEKFYQLWKTELDLVKSQNGHYTLPAIEEVPLKQPASPRAWNREMAAGPFATWLKYNVLRQKQPGYNLVTIKIPLGDIKSAPLRAVADICERFSDGYIRVTVQQNFAMRWVHEADLPAVHDALVKTGLAEAGSDRIENIVSCPGTDSCGLSITSSKGLARALSGPFPPGDPVNDDLAGMSLKVSGCQNACAQHQLASIGFQGVGKKVGGHTAPFYELHLGGSHTQIGLQVLKIPAKRILDAVKHLVQWYRTDRQGGETFERFVRRIGKDNLKERLMPFTFLPAYQEDRSFYVDWGDEKDFTTEDLGPGECAGGAYEMMEGFLFEADQELHLASVMVEKGQTGHAVNKAYRAIVAAAKGLLVLEGIDSSIDSEILFKAETLLVGKEILPRTFARLTDQVKDLGPKSPTVEFTQEKIAYAKSFVEASHSAFDKHGRTLKQGKTHAAAVAPEAAGRPAEKAPAKTVPAVLLDLSGVACPINYVKTKLKLEELEIGQRLEVILDEGEPIRNVPKSLLGDGQKILSQEKADDHHYRLLVEKVF